MGALKGQTQQGFGNHIHKALLNKIMYFAIARMDLTLLMMRVTPSRKNTLKGVHRIPMLGAPKEHTLPLTQLKNSLWAVEPWGDWGSVLPWP